MVNLKEARDFSANKKFIYVFKVILASMLGLFGIYFLYFEIWEEATFSLNAWKVTKVEVNFKTTEAHKNVCSL